MEGNIGNSVTQFYQLQDWTDLMRKQTSYLPEDEMRDVQDQQQKLLSQLPEIVFPLLKSPNFPFYAKILIEFLENLIRSDHLLPTNLDHVKFMIKCLEAIGDNLDQHGANFLLHFDFPLWIMNNLETDENPYFKDVTALKAFVEYWRPLAGKVNYLGDTLNSFVQTFDYDEIIWKGNKREFQSFDEDKLKKSAREMPESKQWRKLYEIVADRESLPGDRMLALDLLQQSNEIRTDAAKNAIRELSIKLVSDPNIGWMLNELDWLWLDQLQNDIYDLPSKEIYLPWICNSLSAFLNEFSNVPKFYDQSLFSRKNLKSHITNLISRVVDAESLKSSAELSNLAATLASALAYKDWVFDILKLVNKFNPDVLLQHIDTLNALYNNDELHVYHLSFIPESAKLEMVDTIVSKFFSAKQYDYVSILVQDSVLKSPVVKHIFTMLKNGLSKDEELRLSRGMGTFALLFQADPKQCAEHDNLKWILNQDPMEWSGVIMQMENEAFLGLMPELIQLMKNSVVGSVAGMKFQSLIAQPSGETEFLNFLPMFMDFLKDNADEFSKSHLMMFWDSMLKSDAIVDAYVQFVPELLELIPRVKAYYSFPKFVGAISRFWKDVSLLKSDRVICSIEAAIIDALYPQYNPKLQAYEQQQEVAPTGYINMLAFIGEQDEETAQAVIKKLFTLLGRLERASSISAQKGAAVGSIFDAIQGIAEKTSSKVLTPYKEQLQSFSESSHLTQPHREAAQELLNLQSGISVRQMAQIWAALGLDKSDPFLTIANKEVAKFSESKPSEMYDAMISYDRTQIVIAKRVRDSLERLGISVWFDTDVLTASADVYGRMAEGVLMSKVVIPCLSLNYEANPDKKKELGFAADQVREGKKVVPIRLDNGPFTWSALITAGLLYTYIGDSQLTQQNMWDEAMSLLANEIRSGISEFDKRNGGISSIKPTIEHHDSNIVLDSEEAIVHEPAEEQFDVMLSYNWGHQPTVLKMRDSLRSRGFKVWMDVELMSGNVYAKMAEAVLGSTVIVSCLTAAYEKSHNCKRELEFSWDQVQVSWLQDKSLKKSVIPAYLEEGPFTWSSQITEGLKHVVINNQCVESPDKWESAMDQLSVLIRDCLSGVSMALPGFENKFAPRAIPAPAPEPVPNTEGVSVETYNMLMERLEKLERSSAALSSPNLDEIPKQVLDVNKLSVFEIRLSALESRFSALENSYVNMRSIVDELVGKLSEIA